MIKKIGLYSSLIIQYRVIGALLMREVITRYGRHNIGFLWLFGEPMIFTVGITALWNLTSSNHHSTLPITAFAVTGYSTILLWRNIVNRCTKAVEPNVSLMFHKNVKVIDIFSARIILEVLGASGSFIFLSFLFIFIGWMNPPCDILKIIEGWILMVWFGAVLGILIGALSERSELIERLWHPISYLLFPLSGSAFMVEWLPTSMQEKVLYLPMVHFNELIRDGYFGQLVHASYDIEYAIFCNILLTLVALIFERDTSRRIEPE